MTKFIEGDGKKIPDRWQFISDENDIEIINQKLDWIAYRLMRLTISLGEGMNGNEVNEYSKLFKVRDQVPLSSLKDKNIKSVVQEIPKE